ncbi:hypothetical protein TI05_02855 [Achromatium sp. WMS3]|nr:hypothetical protein TI05_02855 [Achromatium sp. WMS3]
MAIKYVSSRAEYLAFDTASDIRHEFYHGEIFAMSGGSFNHANIIGNIFMMLKLGLRKKPCYPMNSDMRIHTPAGLDTYPDISIYCNHPKLQDNQCTLLNPIVIFEVLSPSTHNYDRGDKCKLYKTIKTLDAYVLVDSEAIWVEYYQRTAPDEWIVQKYQSKQDVVYLEAIQLSLPLMDIYELIAM